MHSDDYFDRWQADLRNLRERNDYLNRIGTLIGVMGGAFLAAVVMVICGFTSVKPENMPDNIYLLSIITYGLQAGAFWFVVCIITSVALQRREHKKFLAIRALEDLA